VRKRKRRKSNKTATPILDGKTAGTGKPLVKAPWPNYGRAAINSSLLALAFISLVGWDSQHLNPALHTLSASDQLLGVAILAPIATLMLNWARKLLISTKTEDKILAQVRARSIAIATSTVTTWWAFCVCTFGIVIYFSTESVYLTCDADAKSPNVVLSVSDGTFSRQLRITPDSQLKADGIRIFPAFGRRRLTFDVIEPPGFTIPDQRIAFNRSIRLQVPSQFAKLNMRVYRVLPPPPLLLVLPEQDGPSTHRYDMTIGVDGKPFPMISDVRRGSVYFGAHDLSDLHWCVDNQPAMELQKAYQKQLHDVTLGEKYIGVWTTHRRVVNVPAFPLSSTITVKIDRVFPDGRPRLTVARGELTLPTEAT
jgi:hypothetical protein